MYKFVAVIFAIVAAPTANAAVQRVDFTLDGPPGAEATGFITYDDAVVLDGEAISGGGICSGPDNSIDYEINFVGGAADGVTFDNASCANPPAFCNVPDFSVDVNFFGCNASGFSGNGTSPNTFTVSGVDYIFSSISAPAPASPAIPVPVLPLFGPLILCGLLGVIGLRKLKK